jgi:hypothetical protein|nr:MAG TPA: hypothetical protein [Caudoviricetes sp.]
MEKPASLLIEETRHDIINILNESKLHSSILELIMRDIMNDVTNASARVKNKELEEYNNKVLEEAKNNSENEQTQNNSENKEE